MNCEQATERFVAQLAGEEVAGTDAALAAHLAACAACRDATESLTSLWSELGALPDAQPSPMLRARFEALMAGWTDAAAGTARRASNIGRMRGWLAGLLATPRPAQWGGALALLVLGFGAGTWVTMRGSDMQALRHELQSTRSMMALSLLQQRSPADRLQGIGFSARTDTPDAAVLDALFETLASDPSVDVRLAAVDALSTVRDDAALGPRLVEALGKQPSPLVQVALIDALVRRHDSRAQPLLQEILADSRRNRTVRERARWALQQLTM